jgi:hypothetical protein
MGHGVLFRLPDIDQDVLFLFGPRHELPEFIGHKLVEFQLTHGASSIGQGFLMDGIRSRRQQMRRCFQACRSHWQCFSPQFRQVNSAGRVAVGFALPRSM